MSTGERYFNGLYAMRLTRPPSSEVSVKVFTEIIFWVSEYIQIEYIKRVFLFSGALATSRFDNAASSRKVPQETSEFRLALRP